MDESKAKEFLNSPRRQKRQLWDRTRPEVQQWYQQFLYRGFDEAVGTSACWRPGSPQGSVLGAEAWLRKTGHRKLAFRIHFKKDESP